MPTLYSQHSSIDMCWWWTLNFPVWGDKASRSNGAMLCIACSLSHGLVIITGGSLYGEMNCSASFRKMFAFIPIMERHWRRWGSWTLWDVGALCKVPSTSHLSLFCSVFLCSLAHLILSPFPEHQSLLKCHKGEEIWHVSPGRLLGFILDSLDTGILCFTWDYNPMLDRLLIQ